MLATTSLRRAVAGCASDDGLHSRAANTLTEVLAELPETERFVLSLYYEHELTLEEVGQVLGFSRTKAGVLRRRAVRRLQEGLRQRLPALRGARES